MVPLLYLTIMSINSEFIIQGDSGEFYSNADELVTLKKKYQHLLILADELQEKFNSNAGGICYFDKTLFRTPFSAGISAI